MPHKCKVRCIETGVIYNSLAEATKSIGLKSIASICASIKNPNKTAASYHWEYYEESDLPSKVWAAAKCLTNDILFDFTGTFECSNKGRIRQISNGQILSGSSDDKGYTCVKLNNKNHKLHRIIATTFIPNDDPLNKTEVNHIDENKANNCVDNLEWCTSKENSNHGTRTERSAAGKYKKVVCITTNEIFDSIKEGAAKYNIKSRTNISNCCKGNQKWAGMLNGTPLVWKYYDEEE